MFEISCFGDLCSIKCKPWISEWLLFKYVSNHLTYDYICLYVVGVCIVVVVWEVWIKLEKYEFLVKNEFDVDLGMKWCYEFIFVSVLLSFWCMLTNNKVWETILAQRGSKSGFLGGNGVSSQEEPIIMGSQIWWARLAS